MARNKVEVRKAGTAVDGEEVELARAIQAVLEDLRKKFGRELTEEELKEWNRTRGRYLELARGKEREAVTQEILSVLKTLDKEFGRKLLEVAIKVGIGRKSVGHGDPNRSFKDFLDWCDGEQRDHNMSSRKGNIKEGGKDIKNFSDGELLEVAKFWWQSNNYQYLPR